jgi:hypothetical protein
LTPSLIVPALSPAVLQIICLVGFCVGVFLFVSGLRSRRGQIDSSALSDRELRVPNRRSRPEWTSTRSVEIIRLPQNSSPANSTGMTQQQKIAAALQKAGVSSSAGWKNPEYDDGGSPSVQVSAAVTAIADDVTLETALDMKETRLRIKNVPMIWAGVALALLSLYLFLRLRNVL